MKLYTVAQLARKAQSLWIELHNVRFLCLIIKKIHIETCIIFHVLYSQLIFSLHNADDCIGPNTIMEVNIAEINVAFRPMYGWNFIPFVKHIVQLAKASLIESHPSRSSYYMLFLGQTFVNCTTESEVVYQCMCGLWWQMPFYLQNATFKQCLYRTPH